VAAAKRTTRGTLIALLVALIAYTYAMRYRRVDAPAPPALERIPGQAAGYTAEDEAVGGAVIDLLGADATLFRTYRRAGEPTIWLFVAYFASPQEHSQIHSPKHCYPGAGWNILAEGTSRIVVGGVPRSARNLVISNGAERHFVLYWFLSADGVLADEFALKWSQMKSSLLGRSRATVFIRFSMELGADEDAREAARSIARFAEEIAPWIDAATPREIASDDG
jgi:EpsI family protein